jgi:hypothetical protein
MAEVTLPLTIRDLTRQDLPACAWSGPATHLASKRLGYVAYDPGG